MTIKWNSSYEENNYGSLFYSLIRIYQPKIVVELGTKSGYSAYHIAKALKENGSGRLDCYDLWEQYGKTYGFDNTSKLWAENNLAQFSNIVTLNQMDAIGIEKKYKMIDILHIDLDNHADILQKVIPVWINKVRQLIIIEGGSKQRDRGDSPSDYVKMPFSNWLDNLDERQARQIDIKSDSNKDQFVVIGKHRMNNKKPISVWLKNFANTQKNVEYFTIEPFPSITIMRKK